MNATKLEYKAIWFFFYFKILLIWFFCFMFQIDYGGTLIFFFWWKVLLRSHKRNVYSPAWFQAYSQAGNQTSGLSTHREKGPCSSSVRTSQSAGTGAQGNPSSVIISTFNDCLCSGSELRWVYRCPRTTWERIRKKRASLRCLTTSSWLKSYWFKYTWEINRFLAKHGMNIPHMTGRPPVSVLSSVTLTLSLYLTLSRELNLDCPRCAFIRYAEAMVASDYRGLWLQRRDADLKLLRRDLKVVSLLFTQPRPTNTCCLLSRARLAGIMVQEDYPLSGLAILMHTRVRFISL